jgi:hypothetical protein
MAHVKTSRHSLLLSYDVAVTPISKTHMQHGTLQLGATRRLLLLIHRNLPSRERATVAPGNKRDKEHLMLDVVMLAFGLGFFLVAVGYAHACERL